ncbi:hypothetical protein [Glutamicibacter sp. NPDC087344]|uniref:hypothetical protein n=1 Tax=Glutamicibacter sp. NPDC087344 TaxID=3363994 RepID=UPI003817877B
MKMNQYVFDLRRNWLIIAVKSLIVVLFLTGLYSTVSFSESTRSAINHSFSSGNNQNLYSLTDVLTSDDDFSEFRGSVDKVATVGNFYNALNESKVVSLISAFAQPVAITDFRGGEAFDAWADAEYAAAGVYLDPETGKETRDVLSMQMNNQAFDFAHLAVQKGNLPDWEHIDYSTGKIPVLLGANYLGTYELGDEIEGQLYFQPFTFQVSGFLESDSSMFYKDTINFFLDDYLIIPYPPQLTLPTAETLYFDGLLSFAMINTDLVAPKSLSSDEVLSHLDGIGQESGFLNYAMLGVPQYLTQYSLTRSLLIDNAWLVGLLQLALGAGSAFVLVVLGVFVYRRRLLAMDVRWKVGISGASLERSMAFMVLVEWAFIAVLFALVYRVLPNAGSGVVVWMGLLCALIAVVNVGAATFALRHHLYGKKEVA